MTQPAPIQAEPLLDAAGAEKTEEMACWAPDHPDAEPPMTWSDVGHVAVAIACVLAAAFVCWVMPMGPAQ